MEQLNLKYLLGLAKDASIKAGNAIMEVYRDEDFDLQFKSDDSPLTKADNAAHDIIVKCLYSSPNSYSFPVHWTISAGFFLCFWFWSEICLKSRNNLKYNI